MIVIKSFACPSASVTTKLTFKPARLSSGSQYFSYSSFDFFLFATGFKITVTLRGDSSGCSRCSPYTCGERECKCYSYNFGSNAQTSYRCLLAICSHYVELTESIAKLVVIKYIHISQYIHILSISPIGTVSGQTRKEDCFFPIVAQRARHFNHTRHDDEKATKNKSQESIIHVIPPHFASPKHVTKINKWNSHKVCNALLAVQNLQIKSFEK